MQIKSIRIKNYRNLNGISLVFNPTINFLVGETNLGKSNFLILLHTIFNKSRFNDTDFNELSEPIEVTLKLTLDDIEIGLFEDLFDPDEGNTISIIVMQETVDDNITFVHEESGSNIPPRSIKCIKYIYYDSLRNPSTELTFDKKRGVGRFLNHIFNKFLEKEAIEDIDFVDREGLTQLLDFINENLGKIKSFRDFSIFANLEEDTQNLLARLVTLKDEKNLNLQNSGYGVQFLSMICLTIFEKLLVSSKYKRDKGIFEDDEGNKFVAILLGLDEPEIHLHPYMQRSLIRYLSNIINNKDQGFTEVISEIFSIDKLLGQIIISTHSPNILLSDYKQIIRYYKDREGNIEVKNGEDISLGENAEKHLLKNFPYVKEAFFSKCVILVEGDTERGAFPVFADKLNIDLDDNGISIIQAGGADSIQPLMAMLEEFGINAVSILDADKYKEEYYDIENLFSTDMMDFEEELTSFCFDEEETVVLKSIIEKSDSQGLDRKMQKDKLNSIISHYKIPMECFDVDHDFRTNDKEILYPLILAWLNINKSIILGQTIAEQLPPDLIPPKIKHVLEVSLTVAENA